MGRRTRVWEEGKRRGEKEGAKQCLRVVDPSDPFVRVPSGADPIRILAARPA
jgi:hypothetical protein